jgi:hypothetical protein
MGNHGSGIAQAIYDRHPGNQVAPLCVARSTFCHSMQTFNEMRKKSPRFQKSTRAALRRLSRHNPCTLRRIDFQLSQAMEPPPVNRQWQSGESRQVFHSRSGSNGLPQRHTFEAAKSSFRASSQNVAARRDHAHDPSAADKMLGSPISSANPERSTTIGIGISSTEVLATSSSQSTAPSSPLSISEKPSLA